MTGGFYCSACGATTNTLPDGFVTCGQCGHLGLRGYEKRPVRVHCTALDCGWTGWDDGGVNDDLDRHLRREHPEAAG